VLEPIVELRMLLRALERERARLRRLRRALITGAAISGCIPALGAATPLPQALGALAVIWAAFAVACLIVATEELLLVLDVRRVLAQLAPRPPRNLAPTACAPPHAVDRLFNAWSDREQRLLHELADTDSRWARHRRMRDHLFAGAVAASVLCWIDARLGVAALRWAPPLFAFCALSGASVYAWERVLAARRRRIWARWSSPSRAQLQGGYKGSDDRSRVRAFRRTMTAVVALLGVWPFVFATSPDTAPLVVAGFGALWKIMLGGLVAIILLEHYVVPRG
jgi:hypothetical protein